MVVWTRLLPGAALIGSVAAAIAKSGDAIPAGHPAYLVWLVVAGVVGAWLIVWGLRGERPQSGRIQRCSGGWPAACGIGIAVLTFWLAPTRFRLPMPLCSRPTNRLSSMTDRQSFLMSPATGRMPNHGVVLMPGALVDPRAYVPLMRPIAAAGYPVVIQKLPLGIAFLSPNALSDAQQTTAAAGLSVSQWVVAGHSLGGAVGSGVADDGGAAGLILLAAYPIADLSSSGLEVLSIAGSADGLATPEKVAASKTQLPPGTTYVTIDGGIHSFFGDYGLQPGDGEPGIRREEAQRKTQEAMLSFLGDLPGDSGASRLTGCPPQPRRPQRRCRREESRSPAPSAACVGLFGVGGGIVMVPLFVLWLGMRRSVPSPRR